MSAASQSSPNFVWFKSSYSGGNTTECLEAAFSPPGVLIRDSKRPEHSHLVVSAEAWADFLADTRRTQWPCGSVLPFR
ncbi:DUF397 domain-containing protein [Streptomyces sp. BV286]|uniref:DUF397 domain-containing protein n=1 Tax=Streptomyces sp. BV286 TaxID=2849672 RepID=UPI001C2E4640|nr:DUF397 domain-containing protein [Streptomyces sp. BV286]MBV1938282.1 DUF397 domain-containing protein [Streptomyces sp. BV286]